MKKVILFIILTSYWAFGYSQIIMTESQGLKRSSLISVEEKNYFKNISYRGYVETSLAINKLPCLSLTLAPLGIQVNPDLSFYTGISLPLLYMREKTYEGDKVDLVSDYEDDVVTEVSYNYKLSLFIEGKYTLNNIKLKNYIFNNTSIFENKEILPFISISAGYDFYQEIILPTMKIGFSSFNENRSDRLSFFIGFTMLSLETEYYASPWTDGEDCYKAFSLGINYELGGKAGFRKREK